MTTSAATIDVDFFAPEVVADPYPLLAEVRDAGPIVFHEGMQVWMVTSFADIKWVMARPESFHFPPEFESMQAQGVPAMTGHEGRHHDEVRAIWADDFHRSRVQDYRGFITPMVAELVGAFTDRVRAGETVDVVDAVTRHIPTSVMIELTGVDRSRLRDYAHWADEISLGVLGVIDPDPSRREDFVARANAATEALIGELTAEVAKREARPTDDLVGRRSTDPVVTLPVGERVANLGSFLFAGYETTSKLLAHAVEMLARHPDQRRLLLEDRSLIPGAVEELLRYCGLVMMLPRRTTREVEVCGVTIPEGGLLMMMISMANRDPSRWEDPDRFDVTRPPQQHYGFGFGTHLCLGQNLARLEAEIFLDELLDRLPAWELAEAVDYGINFFLRGPQRVRVAAAG